MHAKTWFSFYANIEETGGSISCLLLHQIARSSVTVRAKLIETAHLQNVINSFELTMLFSNHRSPCVSKVCAQESVAGPSESNFLLVYKNISAGALFLNSCSFFYLCSFFSFFLSQTFTLFVIKPSSLH